MIIHCPIQTHQTQLQKPLNKTVLTNTLNSKRKYTLWVSVGKYSKPRSCRTHNRVCRKADWNSRPNKTEFVKNFKVVPKFWIKVWRHAQCHPVTQRSMAIFVNFLAQHPNKLFIRTLELLGIFSITHDWLLGNSDWLSLRHTGGPAPAAFWVVTGKQSVYFLLE